MIQSQIITFGTPAFDEALHLRKIVLRDPLKITFHKEDIELEWNQIHVGLYSNNMSLIGVATIVLLENQKAKVRQVAIHPNIQNQGYGSILNNAIEQEATKHGIHKIILHARETAVRFYEKNGYSKIDNICFKEVGIPHFKMEKSL